MDRVDFEIGKKGLASKVALIVSEFVKEYELDSIDVSVFLTDADVSITESGKAVYGRMLHCVVDTDKEFNDEDYD